MQRIMGPVKKILGSPMAKRARRLRERIEGGKYKGWGGQSAFAKRLKLSNAERWNNIERGVPMGTDIVLLLCQEFPGLTADWLLRGRPEGLTHQMFETLEGKGSSSPDS